MSGHRFHRRSHNPAITLAADFAWRADGCQLANNLVSQWNPYRGNALLAQSVALKRGTPIRSLDGLGGRECIRFSASYYTGTVALGNAQTVATVCRFTATPAALSGIWSSTDGTPSTGTDARLLSSNRINTMRLGANAPQTGVQSLPVSAIVVAVNELSGARLYFTARTPFTNAVASAAFAQSGHALGSVQTTENFPFTGEIAEHACWNRALSQAEIELLLAGWGEYYSLPIAS